jgi:aromatic ring-cleaving dioxygenase
MSTDMPQERLPSEIAHYHAHIYFDAASRASAIALREQIAARFPVQLGRVWEQAAGPHPTPQYQAAFACDQFHKLVPWLMLNRPNLSILIHPNTERETDDHHLSALWLGLPMSIKDAQLKISLQQAGEWPLPLLTINTTPGLVLDDPLAKVAG